MSMHRRKMMTLTAAALATGPLRALARSTGSQALGALFDRFMKENLDISPMTTTGLGLDTGARAHQKSELDDGSEAGIARQKALMASQLARLAALDRSQFSGADAVSYDVIMYGLRTGNAANRAFQYGPGGAGSPYVLSQLTGSYQQVPSFLDDEHSIETRADAEAYLARLQAFARLMDQEIEVVRHDEALGVVPPDFVLGKTLEQMRALRAPPPDQASLTRSIARRVQARGIPGDYAARAARIVASEVYPALERQIALVGGLRRGAVHTAGVARLPRGAEYYAASLVSWATTDQEPAQIHRIGLDLVREHISRIDTLMQAQGMTAGTVGARLHAMYEDPKFLYPNTDQGKDALLADLNRRVRSVRAKLPHWFGALPKADVVIRRVPKEIEAGAPGGYYNEPSLDGKRPGIYWINLRDTAEVPSWTLPTLTYHESIPGHHLQLSIQREAKLPLIRRVSFYSAYIEGWALYAEQLAVEMGEYDHDPLGHIGQLHDSMFRAMRLVMDTGIHAMGWSREQAIRYYTDTLGDPETVATTEVERYCVWPGQACSYMLGKLKFLAERDRARQAHGAHFDIRAFHDAMLLPGAVPLELLDHMQV
ncbi:MAG TPA: DUF885 family protein [Steroidobacteraceae bacterium]|nr:DUF885 family protein [Steroidobacteraceae bacterium]